MVGVALIGGPNECFANIVSIDFESPAYEAGFERGCKITKVNGYPVRDIIDWRWLSSDFEIEVEYIDLDGERGSVMLERDLGQDWGFNFDGSVFDGVRTCRNACTFCFMRQLPDNMRQALSVRDDDFRLSFLEGTFVTFTNTSDADIDRIIEQHISPLRVSLHAVDHPVRRELIGKNEDVGLDALERLMDAGISFDAQIVLVPGVNDGNVLDETISWAYSHPQIKTLGIVPLGYTDHQGIFTKSFDDSKDSLLVLNQIEPYQRRAMSERGNPWVYAADEFYCNAYGSDVIERIPDADFYGDFSMFEDGIGIVRSAIDSWKSSELSGEIAYLAEMLTDAKAHVYYLCGESMRDYANRIIDASEIRGLFEFFFVKNRFFGGNVNITGLLCGCDIADAAKGIADASDGNVIIAIPDIVFNDDHLTLDDWTLDEIKSHIGEDSGAHIIVTSSNPLNYIAQLAEFAKSINCDA